MYEKYPYSVDITYFTSAHREKFYQTHYTRYFGVAFTEAHPHLLWNWTNYWMVLMVTVSTYITFTMFRIRQQII